MQRTKHAQEITNRFRELVEADGDALDANHYDQLALLIEAGIDASLVDYMESMADKVDKLAHDIRHSAEFFEE